jgi:hypothetical protein
MKTIFAIAGAAGLLMMTAVSADAGWSRSGSISGPRGGTATTQGGGSCSGGSCSYGGSITGPQGRTATRQGNVSCNGAGQCETSGTYTGPRGHTVTRGGTLTFSR